MSDVYEFLVVQREIAEKIIRWSTRNLGSPNKNDCVWNWFNEPGHGHLSEVWRFEFYTDVSGAKFRKWFF